MRGAAIRGAGGLAWVAAAYILLGSAAGNAAFLIVLLVGPVVGFAVDRAWAGLIPLAAAVAIAIAVLVDGDHGDLSTLGVLYVIGYFGVPLSVVLLIGVGARRVWNRRVLLRD